MEKISDGAKFTEVYHLIIIKDIRMESDTSVIWLGYKPSYRQKLISLEE